jgi:hypothetical protein
VVRVCQGDGNRSEHDNSNHRGRVRLVYDRQILGAHPEEYGDEVQWQDDSAEHGQFLYCAVLLGCQQGIVGVTQLAKHVQGAVDGGVDLEIVDDDALHILGELLAEELAAAVVQRLQDLAVQVGNFLEVQQCAGHFGDGYHHLALLALEYLASDFLGQVFDIGEFVEYSGVQLAQEVEEDGTSTAVGLAVFSHFLDFEILGVLVQRVNSVVSGGDEDVLADDEVNFLVLIARRVSVLESGEVEDAIYICVAELDARLAGGGRELFGDEGVDLVGVHEAGHFFGRALVHVNPRLAVVSICVNHDVHYSVLNEIRKTRCAHAFSAYLGAREDARARKIFSRKLFRR